MKRLAVTLGLLAAFGAGAQIVTFKHRALTLAEARSLSAFLRPMIEAREIDPASLETDATFEAVERHDAWWLHATVWRPAAVTPTGLCGAEQLSFEAKAGGRAWKPARDSARERYVWQGVAPACPRIADPVSVADGLDPAKVAAVVRGDNHIHEQLAALAVAVCGGEPSDYRLDALEDHDRADFLDKSKDGYPKIGVVMRSSRRLELSIDMSVRFGPRGPESWNGAGCAEP